jgi:hypothetical protein
LRRDGCGNRKRWRCETCAHGRPKPDQSARKYRRAQRMRVIEKATASVIWITVSVPKLGQNGDKRVREKDD